MAEEEKEKERLPAAFLPRKISQSTWRCGIIYGRTDFMQMVFGFSLHVAGRESETTFEQSTVIILSKHLKVFAPRLVSDVAAHLQMKENATPYPLL
jgi:hypothetical protein